MTKKLTSIALLFLSLLLVKAEGEAPFSISGIYPSLAMFNEENECGTGAVVPWAGKLWVITYAPHAPLGSTDKLYEISPDLRQTVRPESIGGTPANRMIHQESQQLFIGPYAISSDGEVRVIPYDVMRGRPTGNARHLTDPENRLYYATMEEGFYEVNVHSLAVNELYSDTMHSERDALHTAPFADLPGAHGKGLYSGQGRLVYSNNGERGSSEVNRNPFMTSGSLMEWDGADWNLVRRAQFTEVTGPGGIYGSANPDTDPIWAVGWDAKSLLLMLLDDGVWHSFRLPKASHSYDGAHGWNTEWPRIREIGEPHLLMTMHGMLWEFPKMFSAENTAGIRPLSTYLKVIGDFTRWRDHVVFGCDDTAKNEFLNKRKAKGELAAPQSQSNLWFLEPDKLDEIGPAIGRGAVWLNEDLKKGSLSDPMLVDGFEYRGIHLSNGGFLDASLAIEVDRKGRGDWQLLEEVSLKAGAYRWYDFSGDESAIWARIRNVDAANNVSAWFELSERDGRARQSPARFAGLATANDEQVVGGLVHAMSGNQRKLQFAAEVSSSDGAKKLGYYQLDGDMRLQRVDDDGAWEWMQEEVGIPSRRGVLTVGRNSAIYTAEDGRRFHLPKSPTGGEGPGPLGWGRLDREVATERDLFNCQGTFYELPAENASGFSRIRPVSSHNLAVKDYCSYRGLFVMSGIDLDAVGDNPHVIVSEDERAALWVGAVDDLWTLGKPVGVGGPWYRSHVGAEEFSDPYLIRGYDRKRLEVVADRPTTVSIQVDITGDGDWRLYKMIDLAEGELAASHVFPEGFQAYWIRFASSRNATLTTELVYD